MLCGDCERFLNTYETPFFNQYLDKLMKYPGIPSIKASEAIDTYFFTVSWRILYDDLYVQHSFANQAERIFFEEFEQILWKYLYSEYLTRYPEATNKPTSAPIDLAGKTFGELIAISEKERSASVPSNISLVRNYVFTLSELDFTSEISDLFSYAVCGYSFFDKAHEKYNVISLYKGLVIITVYHRHLSIYRKRLADFLIDNSLTRRRVEKAVKNELIEYLTTVMWSGCDSI